MEKTFQKRNSIDTQDFTSSGKLLLTGEYLVLEGAKALALKTKFGQSLRISSNDQDHFSWKALSKDGEIWLDFNFTIDELRSESVQTHSTNTSKIIALLNLIAIHRPELFTSPLSFITEMDFEKNWGLGTSSTLISNLAKWSGMDAFKLLEHSFGGSGYDVALAIEDHSILYQVSGMDREVKKVVFDPPFKDQIYFVYLNRKQNSQEAISSFSGLLVGSDRQLYTAKVSEITERVLNSKTLEEFEELMFEHENLLSKNIRKEYGQEQLISRLSRRYL